MTTQVHSAFFETNISVKDLMPILTDGLTGLNHLASPLLHALWKHTDHSVHIRHTSVIHLQYGFSSRIKT